MDIVDKQIKNAPPLRFENGEELIEYMKANGKERVILYVSSPRHPVDGDLHNIGGNYVEGYFPIDTPYIQASDFRIGICSYLRAEDAEREKREIQKKIREAVNNGC